MASRSFYERTFSVTNAMAAMFLAAAETGRVSSRYLKRQSEFFQSGAGCFGICDNDFDVRVRKDVRRAFFSEILFYKDKVHRIFDQKLRRENAFAFSLSVNGFRMMCVSAATGLPVENVASMKYGASPK